MSDVRFKPVLPKQWNTITKQENKPTMKEKLLWLV